ncbi:MAG: hypothetical protein D3904_16325 [Candidatus Electrothrix sp. EH2]|nr:hypothetical protein [Candidatus Electrothrix sp. EH2]
MKKKTAALTLIGSFLALGLFATAHGSGRGSGYYDRGSNYEYRGAYGGTYYNGNRYGYRGSNGYERGSRYEYRGNYGPRYSDDDRYEYRGNGYDRGIYGGRYYNDDRYEYRGR